MGGVPVPDRRLIGFRGHLAEQGVTAVLLQAQGSQARRFFRFAAVENGLDVLGRPVGGGFTFLFGLLILRTLDGHYTGFLGGLGSFPGNRSDWATPLFATVIILGPIQIILRFLQFG